MIFSYVIASKRSHNFKHDIVHRGEDTIDKFLEALRLEDEIIQTLMREIVPMQLTPPEEKEFQQATHCHICGGELGTDRIRKGRPTTLVN